LIEIWKFSATDRINMRARTAVVLGAQWGDEGKGKIVDVLSERFAAVARYAAGIMPGTR